MDRVYEERKSQTTEHAFDRQVSSIEKTFSRKITNGDSCGRQSVDERAVLTKCVWIGFIWLRARLNVVVKLQLHKMR
jgi:hypothetical protein